MSKTILITGANRGIGLEFVKQYAQAGNQVLACCREPAKAQELQKLSESFPIQIFPLDVSKEEDIKKISQTLNGKAIDILINNAGIAGSDAPFGKLTYDDFVKTLQVNTIAPVMLSQALLPSIAQGQSKIIVNISSVLGSIELNKDADWSWIPYRASKSGLNAATKSIANQLKKQNITVIALHPGWVQTDMGGQNAAITPEVSVKGMRDVIDRASLTQSGHFLGYDGKEVAW